MKVHEDYVVVVAPQSFERLLAVADHVDFVATLRKKKLQEILGDLAVIGHQYGLAADKRRGRLGRRNVIQVPRLREIEIGNRDRIAQISLLRIRMERVDAFRARAPINYSLVNINTWWRFFIRL